MHRMRAGFFGLLAFALWAQAPSARAGERCGPNFCEGDEVCCNEGCGICTKPGGACIMPFCEWGRPGWIDAVAVPGADVFPRARAVVGVTQHRLDLGFGVADLTTLSVRADVQAYVARGLAVRLGLGGVGALDADAGFDDTADWSAVAGLTAQLPELTRLFSWALVLDVASEAGLDALSWLTPRAPVGGRALAVAAGLAFADRMNMGPLTAKARWVQAFPHEDGDPTGTLELAAGLSTDLRWIRALGGPEIPLGLRAGYRFAHRLTGGELTAHELGGGLYLMGLTDELRLGLDAVASWTDVAGAEVRALTGLLRLDYYWESNH